jgi:hypothetical protein
MMTQEEFMDVMAMKRQRHVVQGDRRRAGLSPGDDRQVVSRPGDRRRLGPSRRQGPGRWIAVWADRLTALLVGNPKLLATSLFEIVSAEGFTGSYPTVARWVRAQRGPRFRAADGASVPIETPPGEEAQFDWSDCSAWAREVGLGADVVVLRDDLVLVALADLVVLDLGRPGAHLRGHRPVLRRRRGCPEDRPHRPDGRARAVPGRRFVLHPPTLEFARHYGVEIKACQAGDAKRKGKVERPFRDLKESFLQELVVTGVPDSIDELNDRGRRWVDERVHNRVHRSTGSLRRSASRSSAGFFAPLPARRFDTDYVETRRVHRALPFITWNGVRYSVPPACLGQTVEVRGRSTPPS